MQICKSRLLDAMFHSALKMGKIVQFRVGSNLVCGLEVRDFWRVSNGFVLPFWYTNLGSKFVFSRFGLGFGFLPISNQTGSKFGSFWRGVRIPRFKVHF